jgi:hypothetical protein
MFIANIFILVKFLGNFSRGHIYDRTGIKISAFMKIFCSIRGDLEKPRSGTRKVRVTLSSKHRLLKVLQWMQEYPKLKVLGQLYGVSRLFAKREIRHLIPILFDS